MSPIWRGTKARATDGIGWNVFHYIQTMKHKFILSINLNIA